MTASALLSGGIDSYASRFDNLGAALIESARERADAPALWCKNQQLSYTELFERAGAQARSITSEVTLSPLDRVAILAERTPTAYAGILTALLAGAGYVPLNPRFPLDRNAEILRTSGARVLICDEKHREYVCDLADGSDVELLILPESQAEAINGPSKQKLATSLPPAHLDQAFPAELQAGELAYLFFTSGSTGKPKGVPITHRNVFAYLDGIRSFCRFQANDRVLQIVDLSFDLSVHDMFLTWLSGGCLYSVPENSVLLAPRLVQEFGITAWLSVPSTAAWLKEAKQLGVNTLPSLRHTFFCGEALPGAVAQAWAEAAASSAVYNIYGPTEATVAFSWFRYVPGQQPAPVVPLGHPLPGQSMGLFEADGTRAHATGEICLAGSQVTSGYWQAPALTAERFFDAEGKRWYRTGDLGRFDENDGYHYAGRADHQVKLRGYRVELQEIEHVVREVGDVDLVAVVSWPADPGVAAMGCVAFVGTRADIEDKVISGCRKRLPEYMVPMRVFALDDFPFNSNGKVDYPTLRNHPFMKELG